MGLPRATEANSLVRDRLSVALPATALRIDHVGSTSVPGLAARPIIDIQSRVAELDDETSYQSGCVRANFELYRRHQAHRFFVTPLSMHTRDTFASLNAGCAHDAADQVTA